MSLITNEQTTLVRSVLGGECCQGSDKIISFEMTHSRRERPLTKVSAPPNGLQIGEGESR